jgi:hypothetical protein
MMLVEQRWIGGLLGHSEFSVVVAERLTLSAVLCLNDGKPYPVIAPAATTRLQPGS